MQNAQDSTTLSAALEKAKHEQTDLSTGGKIDAAKDELAKLKGETQGLEQKKTQTANELEAHNKEIDSLDKSIKQQESTISVLTTDFESKKGIYDSLLAEYNSIKDTDMNAATLLNAKVQAAKADMDNAERKLNEAKEKKSQDEAKLADLKTKTEGYKKAADDAKDAFDKNVEDIKTKEKEIETMEKTKKDLDTEIPKQQTRLEKLQEKDKKALEQVEKELKNIEKDIEKTKDDKKKTQLEQKKEDFTARQKDIKKRQAIMNKNNIVQQDFVNGQQYKKVSTPDGNIYLIDGKEVSENFYNDQYNKYKTENA